MLIIIVGDIVEVVVVVVVVVEASMVVETIGLLLLPSVTPMVGVGFKVVVVVLEDRIVMVVV